MLKIGILSDTHKKSNRAKIAIDFLVDCEVTHLIHAGDIGEVETLEYMKKTGLSYHCVFGNNDSKLVEYMEKYSINVEPYYFEIEGVSFKLMHHPFYLTPDADVVIYGHTHYFEADCKSGKLFLNSGEVCARNKPISECVVLEVHTDKYLVQKAQRDIGKKEFKVSKMEFER